MPLATLSTHCAASRRAASRHHGAFPPPPSHPITTTTETDQSSHHQARVDGTIHPLLPSKLFRPDAAVSDSFLSTKRDRRTIRRSVFVSRVADSSSSARASSGGTTTSSGRISRRKSQKSREAKNRLGNLSALASALDDLEGEGYGGGASGDDADGGRDAGEAAKAGRIRHRSMKMTKGALKRKERIVRGEMQRFGVSMAKLAETGAGAAASTSAATPSAGLSGVKEAGKSRAKAGDVAMTEGAKEQPQQPTETGNRWAALRGYISSTMEQNPAFKK